MKKTLIVLSLLTLPTFALANEEHAFYFKANVGANKMMDAKQKHEDIKKSTKSKSEISPAFGIGAGYYINNIIRTDLTFDYLRVNFKKGKNDFIMPGENPGEIINEQLSLSRKASIYSLMLNGYIEMPTTESFNIFVGAGVGIARIKEKIQGSLVGALLIGNNILDTINEKQSDKSKNKNNFAYSLTVGTSLKISSNAYIDFSYSWKDFGSTAYKMDKDGDKADKNRYNGHIGVVGIRFNI
jgi:opacity protein-like surface antigen